MYYLIKYIMIYIYIYIYIDVYNIEVPCTENFILVARILTLILKSVKLNLAYFVTF